jgi:phage-related protein
VNTLTNIGLRINLDGANEYKKALSDINQGMRVLKSEMDLAVSGFDKTDKSAAALTARNQALGNTIDAQKNKVALLAGALENASKEFGEGDKRTQSYAIQLNKAQAELNGMERELASNVKELESMGDATATASSEFETVGKKAGQKSNELADAGDTADKAGGKFEALGGVMAGVGAAIGSAMAAIGAASVAAGKALYDMTMSTMEAGDAVDKTSQQLGLSRQGYQEWNYILQQSGLTTYHMSYGMRNMATALENLDDENNKVVKGLKALGFELKDIDNMSPEEMFSLAVTAMQELEEGSEKTALAMQIFGTRAGTQLMPLLNETADATEALRQRAHDLGAVMSDDMVNASVELSNQMTDLRMAFSGVQNSISAELLPGFAMITEGLTGILAGDENAGEIITSGVTELVEGIATAIPMLLDVISDIAGVIVEVAPTLITTLVEAITTNLPLIVDAALEIVESLLGGIIAALPALADGALRIVLSLVDAILNLLPNLLEAAVQIVAQLANGIAEALPELVPAVISAVTTIVGVLLDNIPAVLDAALALVQGLARGIIASLPVLIRALPGIVLGIVNFIMEAIPTIINAGTELLMSLVAALPEIIDGIVEAIPEIVLGIVDALAENLPVIIDAGITLFTSLLSELPMIILELKLAMPRIIMGIVDGLMDNIDNVITAGFTLFTALMTPANLVKIIAELVRNIPQIIDGITTAIAGSIPELANTGLELIRGLWQGMSDAGAWLMSKVRDLLRSVTAEVRNFLGIRSPSRLYAEIGKNMGEGIGVGFENAMDKVTDKMQECIPKDFDFPNFDFPPPKFDFPDFDFAPISVGFTSAKNNLAGYESAEQKMRTDSSNRVINVNFYNNDFTDDTQMQKIKRYINDAIKHDQLIQGVR